MSSTKLEIVEIWPHLERAIPRVALGEWPTPVEELRGSPDVWVKRDDISGGVYGGNKVRPLEILFAAARAASCTRIWATGSVGSNHALATVLHAPAAGLEAGVMLFPQPPSPCARENLLATLAAQPRVRALASWATLPLGMMLERRRSRGKAYVMAPGGATPEGALGYVSAAFELAAQIRAGALPTPAEIVLGVGSTCTAAGLLAGVAICARLGLGFQSPRTRLTGIRVTPWPVTAKLRIVALAARTIRFLAKLTGDARLAMPRAELASRLQMSGAYLGRGYGHVTTAGEGAIAAFRRAGGPALDTTYSGKAAAYLLDPRRPAGVSLFWATKSSRPLPVLDEAAVIAAAPRPLQRWLARPISRRSA